LNPIWPVRDPGWYTILQELRTSEAAQQSLAAWYPPGSMILEEIDELHAKYPHGFGEPDPTQTRQKLETTDLFGVTDMQKARKQIREREERGRLMKSPTHLGL